MEPPHPSNPKLDKNPPQESKTLTLETPLMNPPTPMAPPPPKNHNPNTPQPPATTENHQQPPSPNPNSTQTHIPEIHENPPETTPLTTQPDNPQNLTVPYTIPQWSEPPRHRFSLEILKDGFIIDQFDVFEKGAYMFGRVDLCDFMLEHPTISRFHAVLQFKGDGGVYLYDLGSTHGTFINKKQVKKMVYVDLHVGDVIRFGLSSRLYIFQGPPELMPPEKELKSIRNIKMHEDAQDREASLLRAKREASLADGISWGMGEDAIEEAEDDAEEVTWQTYTGQLTEKQEKTREKVIKRTEKIAHMKKEIDAIRAKDIGQGGLTQGQQTQIARNEQRIAQILEELENLEETLNESIHESLGARTGRTGRRKGATEEEEDELLSDDDEFYDRTKKKSIQKAGENQSVETADTLLDKKEVIVKEIEEKMELILNEKNRTPSEHEVVTESGDALDAYMSGLSSKLVLDTTTQLQNEVSALQTELDRILYLLKIADPTGEAAKKRDTKVQELKPNQSKITASLTTTKPLSGETKKSRSSEKTNPANEATQQPTKVDSDKKPEVVYTVVKPPQWLGAVEDLQVNEAPKQEPRLNLPEPEPDEFVDYKDRKKVLVEADGARGEVDMGLENAAPGLIIRKRKASDDKAPELSTSSSVGTGTSVEDAVALLLKHEKGYYALEDEEKHENEERSSGKKLRKDKKKAKRVLGPEKPSFIEDSSEFETWVPPQGQSGDGRTSLNDRYGY